MQSDPFYNFTVPNGPPSLLPNPLETRKQVDPNAVQTAAQQEAPGYQPPPARQASGDPGKDFLDLASGYSPSAKNLAAFFPQFQSMYPGWNLKNNASGWADAITNPQGQIYDTQRNSGYDKSDAWQFNLAGGPGYSAPDQQVFNDPATQLLQSLIGPRVSSLMSPQSNPQLDSFLSQASDYIKQQQAPVYSTDEEKALRVKVFDNLERDRQTALQQARERLGQMGHGKDSGTFQIADDLVNRRFDQTKANLENQLFTGTIAERQRRLQDALNVGAQAANATSQNNSVQDARQGQALTTASILPTMASDRLGAASSFLGAGGSSPASVGSTLAQLLSQTNTNDANSSYAWQNIATLIQNALRSATR